MLRVPLSLKKKMCARTCFHIFHVMSLFTSRFSSLARVLPQGYHSKSARVTRGRAGRGLLPSTRGVDCCLCGRLCSCSFVHLWLRAPGGAV